MALLWPLLAAALSVVAWQPFVRPDFDLWKADDGEYHLLRVYVFEAAVTGGAWLPRWTPDLFVGYGYPIFNFYAPGTYYAALVLRALGLDVYPTVQALGAIAAAGGAAGAFCLARAVFGGVLPGLVAAAAFVYAPYPFITNLLIRADLAEALGLALLPWTLLAAWRAGRRPGRAAVALLTAAMGSLILTHNLTALVALPTAAATALFAALTFPSGHDRHSGPHARLPLASSLLPPLHGLALALALTAFFWGPALVEQRHVQIEVALQGGHKSWRSWLIDPLGATEQTRQPGNPQTPAGPLDLHLAYPYDLNYPPKPSLAQGALFGLSAALVAAGLVRRRPGAAAAAFFLGGTALLWLLTTTWGAGVWERVPLMRFLQFSWRLYGPLALGLALTAAGATAIGLSGIEDARRPGPPAGGPGPATGPRGRGAPAPPPVRETCPEPGEEAEPGCPGPPPGRGPGMVGGAGTTDDGNRRAVVGRRSSVVASRRLLGALLATAPVVVTVLLALNTTTARPLWLDPAVERRVGGPQLVGTENGLFGAGTTTGGEFVSRAADLEALGPGRRRGNGVYERLYPEFGWLAGRLWPLEGRLRVAALAGGITWTDARVIAETPSVLGFRTIAFPGWRAYVDGREVAPGVAPRDESLAVSPGFLTVAVPPGEHRVQIAFGSTPARAAAGAASVAALAWLGWWAAAAGRRRGAPAPRRRRGLALAPAALLALACTHDALRPATGAPVIPAAASSRLVADVIDLAERRHVRVSSPSGPGLGPFVQPKRLAIGSRERRWLYMHPPASVSLALDLPPRAALQAGLALDPAAWDAPEGDGVRFVVELTPEAPGGPGGPTLRVFEEHVNPRATDEQRRWLDRWIDLSAFGGRRVTLTLRTDPGDSPFNDWAGWAEPVVIVQRDARRPGGGPPGPLPTPRAS